MIYRLLMLSDEADNFVREIKIDSEATFLDLHDIILRSVGYAKDQMSSFFTCDDDWGKETEITLVDMGTSSEEDSHVMGKTRLEDLLGEEGQKLLYVFDYLTERAFFIELREIIPGERIDKPLCTRSEGAPPSQEINFEELEAKRPLNELMDEEFYGDSEYDIDELDSGGFGGLDNDSPFNEDRY